MSYSIAKKVQYNFAERLLSLRGFEDIIEAKYEPGMIKDKVFIGADPGRIIFHSPFFLGLLY